MNKELSLCALFYTGCLFVEQGGGSMNKETMQVSVSFFVHCFAYSSSFSHLHQEGTKKKLHKLSKCSLLCAL